MADTNLLAKNLKRYQQLRGLTISEFARELDISKSTLRSILKHGNTTIDTATRISHSLNISLDTLIRDETFPEKIFILNHMQKALAWFAGLPAEKQEEVSSLLAQVWEVLEK